MPLSRERPAYCKRSEPCVGSVPLAGRHLFLLPRPFWPAPAQHSRRQPRYPNPACSPRRWIGLTSKGKPKSTCIRDNPRSIAGDVAPLAFVSDLKVNTDGTRISYKVDDPTAQHGAINDMRNAMRSGTKLADFTAIAATGWMPFIGPWEVLSDQVIEKDKATGKPCVTTDNYLVSKTSDVAVAGGFSRDGDCDQSKWIDALTIPALVLPEGNTEFKARGALTRTPVVVMTLDSSRRIAFGIVGDYGPSDELGEASVEMNRVLNGLALGSVPTNGHDAIAHYQAPRSVVLLFPGATNRVHTRSRPTKFRKPCNSVSPNGAAKPGW